MSTVVTKIINRPPFGALVDYMTKGVQADELYGAVGAQAVAVAEILALHSAAPAAHLILSYDPGQLPTTDQVLADVHAACTDSGWESLPRTSALHRMADSVHVHVAVAVSDDEAMPQDAPFDAHKDAADLARCGHLLSQNIVIFASPRTGKGIGPILPHLLDVAS